MKKLLLFALLLPTLAGAQIVKPGKPGTGGGGSATPVVNNLNQSTTGSALDAVQGATLKNMVAAKLNINDTTSFIRKITGWRLTSPTEINKLANVSGINTGDQIISISGSRITLSGGGGFVDVPSTGGSTPIANNLTTTTAGSALDATQGKVLKDAVDANTTAIGNKQNTITSSSNLTAGSLVVNASADSDSLSNKAATMKYVRDYVLRTMPSFIDFPYDTAYFSFGSQFTAKVGAFRRLFTPGAGITINYATGEITSTATGGASSNLVTATDQSNSSANALYLVPNNNNERIYFGSASKKPYEVSFENALGVSGMPGIRFRNGGLTIGGDTDAAITRYGNVISANSSSSGTGTDQGFKWYGSKSYRRIKEDDGSTATLLATLTLDKQLGIGTETPTANLDVVGTANVSGATRIGGQLTVPSVKFAADNSVMASAPATVCNSLAELGAATTRLAIYDGSHWVRVSGTVESNVGVNTVYTVTQYNSGSDHYERQFMGRAKFEWWKNSASNTWEQMKYAANSQIDVQVANGDYYFNERVYTAPGAHIFGNETSPDSVRFHINGPNPYLFMNWPWMDGTNGMQGPYRKKAENIVLAGFSLYNESSYVAKRDTNDFYGPISFDGGGSFNNVIRNIRYKQVSSTAIVNAILVKMGTQKVCESLLIENVQSLASNVKGRMLVEVLNQGDGTNSPERVQIPAKNVVIKNCLADGFRFGLSIAGYFIKPKVVDCTVRNCTDYGIEFAGPLVDGEMDHCAFGGTQNVLIAGNYVSGSAADWVFPAGSGQRYTRNYTEGKVTGGYVEIRSGGVIDFSDNNFQIDGGVLLQNTQFAGVRGGQFTRNRIISTMTNSNWRNQAKAVLLMNGATGLDVSNNYLERGGTDADALIQSNANGVSSVSNRFYNNVYQVGTNGTYYGINGTTAVRFNNFDVTGTARN